MYADQMVVDYDVGSDREYFPVDGMTETKLVALTPSGGTHEYYALAEGEKASNSASKLGPPSLVRCFNRSVHETCLKVQPDGTMIASPVCGSRCYLWMLGSSRLPDPFQPRKHFSMNGQGNSQRCAFQLPCGHV